MFEGGIIAISNLPLKRDPLATALSSRVPPLDYEPSDDMVKAFMVAEARKGYLDLSSEECLEVVEFVIDESYRSEYRLDFRYMFRGWQDRRMWQDGRTECDWRDLIRSGMRRITVEEMVEPVGRAERKIQKREIAARLFKEYPTDKAARDTEWEKLTGDSPWSMYRHFRQSREGL